MHNLKWYLADLKSTGKNTIETVERSLTDMFIRLVRIYPCLYFSVSRFVAVVNFPYTRIMEFQKLIGEKSGNYVSMKSWEICIWKTMPDSWTIRPTMKQNV